MFSDSSITQVVRSRTGATPGSHTAAERFARVTQDHALGMAGRLGTCKSGRHRVNWPIEQSALQSTC
jgi:hypothetical protein